jgi:hypothetical protein
MLFRARSEGIVVDNGNGEYSVSLRKEGQDKNNWDDTVASSNKVELLPQLIEESEGLIQDNAKEIELNRPSEGKEEQVSVVAAIKNLEYRSGNLTKGSKETAFLTREYKKLSEENIPSKNLKRNKKNVPNKKRKISSKKPRIKKKKEKEVESASESTRLRKRAPISYEEVESYSPDETEIIAYKPKLPDTATRVQKKPKIQEKKETMDLSQKRLQYLSKESKNGMNQEKTGRRLRDKKNVQRLRKESKFNQIQSTDVESSIESEGHTVVSYVSLHMSRFTSRDQ